MKCGSITTNTANQTPEDHDNIKKVRDRTIKREGKKKEKRKKKKAKRKVDLELAQGERLGSTGDSHEGFDGFLIRPGHCFVKSREFAAREREREKGFRWSSAFRRCGSDENADGIYRHELR